MYFDGKCRNAIFEALLETKGCDLQASHLCGQTMSKNRFEVILQALRFYDTNDKTMTKKNKIDYVIRTCVQNFKAHYLPKKQLSIDEALFGFKGRLSYKQYIPH